MTAEELRKPCVITAYLRCATHLEYAALSSDRCLRAEAFDLGMAAGRADMRAQPEGADVCDECLGRGYVVATK